MPGDLETHARDGALTSTTKTDFSVDDVVNALTNPPSGEEGVIMELKDQLLRAAAEVDRRTAETFGRALVDSLCDDPGDVRRLEALLILGLAHPPILGKYHVSLAQEGRRLCALLENIGESERSRSFLEMLAEHLPEERELQQDLSSLLRRNGDVDELVDRCLKHADEAVQDNRPMDAIPWLQEVLLHDQTRRDVARMIRDLRYQEMETSRRSRRRNRIVLLLVVISTTLSALFVREHKIGEEYAALPPAAIEDVSALNARIDGIDGLIAGNRFWFGMFGVVGERSELRKQKDRLESMLAEAERRRIAKEGDRAANAESLRLRAIDAVAGAKYEVALGLFKESLAQGAPDWERRERVQRNIEAIEELLEGRK